jgi:UDP:flavonoid glycosyltransferase YjiC (YdhE family)
MKCILFAWELGQNLGHAARLLRLARALEGQGYRSVFAFKDTVSASALIGNGLAPVLQAPVWPRTGSLKGRPFASAGFGDILAQHGFARADELGALVRAWDDLIGLVKPDAIVADHAPTACLAAYGAIPLAIVGTGFTVPPANGRSFPLLRADLPLVVAESRLLENVHEVQRRRGRPAPASLPGLFDAPLRAICCFPELDPYRGVRREPVLGPIEPLPAPSKPPDAPLLFGYLDADLPVVDDLLQMIVESPTPAEVFLRGEATALARFLALRGIRVHQTPPPLAEVLPRVSVVVSHGGAGVAHAALTAGRPHLVLPQHLEADLTASALAELGVGFELEEPTTRKALEEALRRVVADRDMADRAVYWSRVVADRPALDPLTLIVEACAKLLV